MPAMRLGITITRDQLESWAGRSLSDAEVARIGHALPHSSVPEAVATIADTVIPSATAAEPEMPPGLARALDAAELLRSTVHGWVSRLRMLNVARLTRTVFATATAVVIDVENQHVNPEGVQLAAVLDSAGAVLWSASSDPGMLVVPPSMDRRRWCPLLWRIEADLTAALGGDDPDDKWDFAPDMVAQLRPAALGADFLYRVDLPAEADLAAVAEPTRQPVPDLACLADVHVALVTTATAAIASGATIPPPIAGVAWDGPGDAVSG